MADYTNNNLKGGGEDNTQADNAVADVFFFSINPVGNMQGTITWCCYPDKKETQETLCEFKRSHVVRALGRAVYSSITAEIKHEEAGNRKFFYKHSFPVRVFFCQGCPGDNCAKCKNWYSAVFKENEFFEALGLGILDLKDRSSKDNQ